MRGIRFVGQALAPSCGSLSPAGGGRGKLHLALLAFTKDNAWVGIARSAGRMIGCLLVSALALCWLVTLLLPTRAKDSVMADLPA
jgi:hypothetical protein